MSTVELCPYLKSRQMLSTEAEKYNVTPAEHSNVHMGGMAWQEKTHKLCFYNNRTEKCHKNEIMYFFSLLP